MNPLSRPAVPRPRAYRTLPLAAAALLAALLALPSRVAAAEESPLFLIETIVLEGTSRPSSAEIIRSEMRLAEGSEYSEGELRAAIYRVRRLPFVLEADLSLRRGSERGKYALAVAVEETNAGFFAASLEALRIDLDLERALGYSLRTNFPTRDSATAGFRLFLGPRGVLFGAAHEEEFQAGYTHYGMFGGNGSASLAISYSPAECCSPGEVLPLGLDPSFSSWSLGRRRRANLVVDYPLGGDQALRLAATDLRAETSSRIQVLSSLNDPTIGFTDEDLTRSDVELKWIYDTRDEPLFPSQGSVVSGGLEVSKADLPLRVSGTSDEGPADARSSSRMAALAVAGARTWSLAPRHAVSLGGRMAAGRSDAGKTVSGDTIVTSRDLHTRDASIEARHSWSLWGEKLTREAGDLRLETTAAAGYEAISPDLGVRGTPVHRRSLGIALVFRNAWGIFRLGLTYLDIRGDPR